MNNDFVKVDELIFEIADYKNDCADEAAEKLLRECATSWEAYQCLRDRVHDGWLHNRAHHQVRRIIKRIKCTHISFATRSSLALYFMYNLICLLKIWFSSISLYSFTAEE